MMIQALLYGIFCTGLGVGMTMIRSIAPQTLKYAAVSAFSCGFAFDLVLKLTGSPLPAGLAGGFLGAACIRFFYEKKKIPMYFALLIASVYPVTPGVAFETLFENAMYGDLPGVMERASRVLLTAAGLTAGILLCGLMADRIYGHRVPADIR